MSDDYLFDCANAEYLDDLSNEELQTQLADANKKVAELEATMKCYECGCGMVEHNGHAIKEIERLEAMCQVLATQVSLARSGDDGKTRQVSEILDKAREQVKGAE